MVKDVDVKLYTEFRKRSKTMPHDELFYAFLDWADKHPEIKNEYIKSIDTYSVICRTGEHQHIRLFTKNDGENPYKIAKMYYFMALPKFEIVELWQKGNEFIGNDKLIMRNIQD